MTGQRDRRRAVGGRDRVDTQPEPVREERDTSRRGRRIRAPCRADRGARIQASTDTPIERPGRAPQRAARSCGPVLHVSEPVAYRGTPRLQDRGQFIGGRHRARRATGAIWSSVATSIASRASRPASDERRRPSSRPRSRSAASACVELVARSSRATGCSCASAGPSTARSAARSRSPSNPADDPRRVVGSRRGTRGGSRRSRHTVGERVVGTPERRAMPGGQRTARRSQRLDRRWRAARRPDRGRRVRRRATGAAGPRPPRLGCRGSSRHRCSCQASSTSGTTTAGLNTHAERRGDHLAGHLPQHAPTTGEVRRSVRQRDPVGLPRAGSKPESHVAGVTLRREVHLADHRFER